VTVSPASNVTNAGNLYKKHKKQHYIARPYKAA